MEVGVGVGVPDTLGDEEEVKVEPFEGVGVLLVVGEVVPLGEGE